MVLAVVKSQDFGIRVGNLGIEDRCSLELKGSWFCHRSVRPHGINAQLATLSLFKGHWRHAALAPNLFQALKPPYL